MVKDVSILIVNVIEIISNYLIIHYFDTYNNFFWGIRMKYKISLLLITLASITTGCGGGGSSASSSNYNGQFYDAPTKGLSYTASPSGLTGTTDSNGTFSFKAGDTVTFSVPTGSGTSINVGSTAPPTPSSTSTPAIVSVLSLPNATAVAQTLQTLGGTGNVIDVSSVSLTSTQAQSINNYVATGGVATAPSISGVTWVSSSTAKVNAISSLSSLSPQTPGVSLSTLLGGTTSFSTGYIDFPDHSVRYSIDSVEHKNSDGTQTSLCINEVVITANYGGPMLDDCNVQGIVTGTIWTVASGGLIQWIESNPDDSVNTVTYKYGDTNSGAFTLAISNIPGLPGGATGVGQYNSVQTGFGTSTLSGKAFTISNDSTCTTDGFRVYTFASGGVAYNSSCRTYSGTNTTVTSGTAANVTALPGVVLITDSSGMVYYVGISKDSTSSGGTMFIAYPGTNNCSYNNKSKCGFVTSSSYTAQ